MILNGVTKIITLEGTDYAIVNGVGTVYAQDVYSRWKDWVKTGSNSKWAPAFRSNGGEPTQGNNLAPKYFYIGNGWRILPRADTAHVLIFDRNLFLESTETGVNPFLIASGVLVNMTVSDAPSVLSELSQEQWDDFYSAFVTYARNNLSDADILYTFTGRRLGVRPMLRSIPATVRSYSGEYVDGVWEQTLTSTRTGVMCSLHPMRGADLDQLPEGLREHKTMKIFTDVILVTKETSQAPDTIELKGTLYNVVMAAPWENNVLTHYEYIIQKVQ